MRKILRDAVVLKAIDRETIAEARFVKTDRALREALVSIRVFRPSSDRSCFQGEDPETHTLTLSPLIASDGSAFRGGYAVLEEAVLRWVGEPVQGPIPVLNGNGMSFVQDRDTVLVITISEHSRLHGWLTDFEVTRYFRDPSGSFVLDTDKVTYHTGKAPGGVIPISTLTGYFREAFEDEDCQDILDEECVIP